MLPFVLLSLLLGSQEPRLAFQDLGGGAKGGPRLDLAPAEDGQPGAFVFRHVPAGATTSMILSWRTIERALPPCSGILKADPFAVGAGVFSVAGRVPVREVSTFLVQGPLVMQGIVVGPSGVWLTNTVEVFYRNVPARGARSRAGRFPRFTPDGRVRVIAHKANIGSLPENTLAAIERAVAAGVDQVELDLRLSADGEPVLIHDWTVDRTTDGTGYVSALTLAQLKALDAGAWKGHAGERIPSLREALETVAGRARLLLDVKENHTAAKIGAVLAELGLPGDAVSVYAYASRLALLEFHRVLPHTPVVWGKVPHRWDRAWFEDLRYHGVVGFDVQWGELPHRFLEAAHRHGMFVFTYTINDPSRMQEAIAFGVDGIETDDPELLRRLLARRQSPGIPFVAIAAAAALLSVAVLLLRRRR